MTGVNMGTVYLATVNVGQSEYTEPRYFYHAQPETRIVGVYSTEEAALEGVYSGEYYAAFVVPADFSEDMMSFLSGEPGTPEIAFYANAKKNAIATKITSKVKTTIQRKINEAFIETVTLYSAEAAESTLGNEDYTSQVVGTLLDRLDSLSLKLDTLVSVVDSVLLLNNSADGMIQTADTDTLKAKTEELNKLLQQMGGAMYQQPGSGPDAGPQPGDMGGDNGSNGGSNGGDDVVDGEFRSM